MIGTTQCVMCVHLHKNTKYPRTCAAFPAGIPDAIFFEGRYHIEPYPGDNGIQFEPKPHGGLRHHLGDPAALRAELESWCDRAAKKADCPVGQVGSDGIKVWVAQRLANDPATAFNFMRAQEDTCLAHEARLRVAISTVLSPWCEKTARAVAAGEPPDYDGLENNLHVAVTPELVSAHREGLLRTAMENGIRISADRMERLATAWWPERVRGIAARLAVQIRERIEPIPPDAAATGIKSTLEALADDDTIGSTAVTATTAAFSAAVNAHRYSLLTLGIGAERIWHTHPAELDADTPCRPLDGQPESVWAQDHPDGPPAHRGCRCHLTLRLV